MIAEDVQRKIWLGGLIGAVILGVLFLIWAVVLNRGTVIINSRAPYTVTMEGLRTESCATDECTIIVAPGDYSMTLQKQGYKALTKRITVPLGSPYKDNLTLEYIPFITETTQTKDQAFPPPPQLTKAQLDQLGISASTQLFFDPQGKVLSYIIRNPENYRQTLYLSTLNDKGEISDPQLVTSFLRDLKNYVVAPSSSGDKVAVIDQAPEQSTLYMVNREAKNRASLATYPVIRDMRWIPGTNDFLFQARPTSGSPESIFLYRWEDGKTVQLDLKTPLDDVAIFDDNRIFAVTNQQLPSGPSEESLLGQLVPLGENQSTDEVRAITTDATTAAVLLFLQGDKVFQLRFAE